jgi:hypothetical protein
MRFFTVIWAKKSDHARGNGTRTREESGKRAKRASRRNSLEKTLRRLPGHRNDAARGCAMAALSGELRPELDLQQVFAQKLEQIFDATGEREPKPS